MRLGILSDFAEEGWPSMDLCAEMLSYHLREDFETRLALVDVRPAFRPRLQRLPWLGQKSAAFNADRLLNRLWDYPRHARRRRADADVFHVVDHSYAQLVLELPANRTGLYCHDLDTFRCLLAPSEEPRPRWFRAMARRILNGFQKAAVVFHSTAFVREQIVRHQLLDPAKLIQAPLGFAPEFRPDPPGDARAENILTSLGDRPYVLHVGSCIPRKRLDVLLKVLARLRADRPDLRLVKVSGAWSPDERHLIGNLGLTDNITYVSGISRRALACLYRGAALVMMPSEAEGFGIPVLEALACGTRVLASDLAVFREVAGPAARYVPVGDVEAFTEAARAWLAEPDSADARKQRTAQAERFSWRRHAEIIGDAYLRLRA
jgi:glycosyltransferase involved in cell wall biosynthesis